MAEKNVQVYVIKYCSYHVHVWCPIIGPGVEREH